jgi:hypothetical protein
MRQNERDFGSWILPQPREKDLWVSIPKPINHVVVPFGYEEDPDDEGMWKPIPLELEYLEQAKIHLKKYSARQVAAWLTTRTGRSITYTGLLKRVRSEQSYKSKARYYRELARRLTKALDKIEEYEEKTKRQKRNDFFDSDSYVSLRARAAEQLASDSSE